MPPVVAVCPTHGEFASQAIDAINSRVTLANNWTDCPICGRPSRVMEGTFDFDADGFAHVVSAPEWSSRALRIVQQELEPAARALVDRRYSDDRAYALLDAKLDRLIERVSALDPTSTEAVVSMKRGVRAEKKRLSRRKLGVTLLAVVTVCGWVADLGGAIEVTGEVLATLSEQIAAQTGSTGYPHPLPQLPPEEFLP